MNTRRSDLAQIRRSPAAAKEIVKEFVSPRYMKPVLAAIAHSVERAQLASSSKWGLRLNRNSIMLKVGFVEVLQVGDGWFHELALTDLIPRNLRSDSDLVFHDPPYVNAPDCETCDMGLSKVQGAYAALRPAHEAAIDVAAKSRRHTSTAHDHSPGLIIFISEQIGAVLPQPDYIQTPASAIRSLPKEVPPDEEFEEGAVTQVLVNRYERDPSARERCIEHYGTTCVVCGLKMSDVYGQEVAGLIHVHHLTPLASVGGPSTVDPIRDLRPVCPNCHAVIHSVTPPRAIEEVQAMFRSRSVAPPALPADVPSAASRRKCRG